MKPPAVLNSIPTPGWRLLAWLGVLVVLNLSLMPLHVPAPLEFWNSDKLVHVGMYATLMLCFGRGYPPAYWWRIAFALGGLGLVIECLQGLMPTRQASLLDECANASGVAIMLWALKRRPGAGATSIQID